jgi:hypothetical protein
LTRPRSRDAGKSPSVYRKTLVISRPRPHRHAYMAFISPEDRAFMSPSSSPGGSPSASSFVDSSPLPSSPSLQPIDLGRPPTPLGISHPFAGSTHATTHPSHELRYSNSSYTPATWAYRPDITSAADRTKVLESFFDEEEGFSTSSFDPEPPDEATLWEERITRAVDTGEAEFTWKYVSIPSSTNKHRIFTEPQEMQGLPLCPRVL